MRKVLAFGTFEYLHPGHVFFLREAKKLGDHLTVIIARTKNVARVKGRRPDTDEQARKELVAQMRVVDAARLGDEEDVYACIREVRPDVIALGYDQEAFVAELKNQIRNLGLRTKIVRLRAFGKDRYKSTLLRRTAKKKGEKDDAKVFLVPLAIIVDNERIFLQQRNDPGTVHHRKWEFPGGSVEWGETPEQCLEREVKEETGLTVRPVRILPKIYTNYRVYDWGRVQIVLMPYACVKVKGDLRLSSREVLHAGWYRFSDAIKKDLLPNNRAMIRLAQHTLHYD